MRYTVTYLIAGKPGTVEVEALDAAGAVATAEDRHDRAAGQFELLSVQRAEDVAALVSTGRAAAIPSPR